MKIIHSTKMRCTRMPCGDGGLEGWSIGDEVHVEYIKRDDGKRHARVYFPDKKPSIVSVREVDFSTCSIAVLHRHFEELLK